MGVLEYLRINEARDAANADAPVAPNVLNDTLAADGSLSIGVVENTKMNEALADEEADASATAATSNSPEAATSNMPTAAATPNAPMAETTSYTLASADTLNVTVAETP